MASPGPYRFRWSVVARGFRLTPADVAMIRRVYEYRFLQADHLSALANRSYKKVHARLLKLVQHRFLARVARPFQKHLYAMGREGNGVLVEQGIAPLEAIETRLRHHERTELFLKHQLMIVDLHAMLELACRGTSVRLAAWREGKNLWDSVMAWRNRERVRLPVRPDAFFVLEDSARPDGRNRLNFFLEADRSTATRQRFQEKLVAYERYREEGLHTQKYGIKMFRVVTFTLTEERARGLCAAAREALPPDTLKHFLFASAEGLSLANPRPILGEIFLSPPEDPASGVRHRLVPEL